MSKSNLLNEIIGPKVLTSIKDPSFKSQLKSFFGKYIDKNNQKFSEIGPCENIFFTTDDHAAIYKLFNVTENEMRYVMQQSTEIKYGENQNVKPINLLTGVAIKILDENNMPVERDMMVFLMLMTFFPLTYSKYFKYNPNREIMAYTINNMNNRFDIKRKGYLKSLQDLGQGAYNNCIQKLSKGSDKDYAYFSCDMKNRINSYMKNIRGEFDLNYKEGNYLNLDSDNYDEDDFHISENDTLMIRRLRDATVLKFLTQAPDMKLIQYAAKLCTVSVNEMRNIIVKLQKKTDANELNVLIESIINEFVVESKHSINLVHSTQFFSFALLTYKKNSAVDSNVKRIKDILTIYLDRTTDFLRKTTREATINNFKRAIYIYFVLIIQQTA